MFPKLNPNRVRACKLCGIEKPYSTNFRPQKRTCRECENKATVIYHRQHKEQSYKANRAWRERNRDWQKNRDLIRAYGITLKDYNDLLEKQNKVCAICCKPDPYYPSLAVDHDHRTGKVRGLLCGYCNIGLSKFKDSPDLLVAAQNYLLDGVKLEYVESL